MILTINDKTYPLQFGMGAVERYCDQMDCDVDDIDIHLASPKLINQLKAINRLTLCGIENGCDLAKPKIDFDITYGEFQLWLDNQSPKMISDIISHWKDTSTLGVKVSEYYNNELLSPEDEPVKKVAKKKSQSEKS